ncbi:phosphate-starvation-inducible PsiE family protein [Cyanobacterium stanieri LEGE 03274]|uniref:Phosphate-starvation-inducible PsiE family protein n=1 Tax=Cyanobacterium stanieri LEGE 03274 TaxID=1828756 RepID=A0ABR9V9A0_9CHRO|nr:phosphate-starvation-inducible PsiE family protein [Cyanobacterium stanieri]MBE9223429.1 phosphate-starvation-inducible PsiE family protein [Cyanobacterium stanieri LEGE 03274]
MREIINFLREAFRDKNFLKIVHLTENIVSKVLSLGIIIVVFICILDLIFILANYLFITGELGYFASTVFEVFGLFLNILIALELLENITVYLRKHILQLELVLTTALIAVARKIIIFDPKQYDKIDLMALGIAIICLSASYWLVRKSHEDK